MIDTEVKGNAASVEEAAHFLSASLAQALDDAADRMPPARRVLESSWRGSSADAYSSVIGRILTAVDKESSIARNAGRKLGEYATVLRAIQDRMADRRDEATAAGLTVAGMIIKEPAEAAAPDTLPANASDAEQQAWQRDTAHYASQVKKIELYNSLATEIQEDFERFRQWIETELKGAVEEFDASSTAATLNKAIQTSSGAILSLWADYNHERLKQYSEEMRARANSILERAAHARKALRSGNPEVRSAAKDVDIRGSKKAAKALQEVADSAGKIGKSLPVVGLALDVGDTAYEISQGASPGKAILSTGAGVVMGAAGGVIITAGIAALGVSAPVIVPVAAGMVVGMAAAAGADYLWDHCVSASTKEAIDDGLKEFGRGVADVGENIFHKIIDW